MTNNDLSLLLWKKENLPLPKRLPIFDGIWSIIVVPQDGYDVILRRMRALGTLS